MPQHFVRCPACGLPYPSEEEACPGCGAKTVAGNSMPPPSSLRRASGVDSLFPPESMPSSRVIFEPPESPQPSRDAPLIGRLLNERYRIDRVIARGGMGVVYEGVHVGLGRPVAVKTIQPRYALDRKAVSAFHNEAALAGRFGHPNIVEVFDKGILEDGSPYLVMERLSGETVTDLLKRRRPLPVGVASKIARQVLAALMVTHHEGILHLDLKPDNLWIATVGEREKVVKVIDFGVARVIGRAPTLGGEGGLIAGTPAFMAPEQAEARRDIDARADLYALGMILYLMLTGCLPYKAPTAAALLQEMKTVTPTRPAVLRPEVPRALDALTMKAVARAREDRFPDAASMLRELSRASAKEAESPETSRSPSLAPPPDPDHEKVEYFTRDGLLTPPPR